MVEKFKRFLPRTEPWHSFGRGACAALIVGALELLGAPLLGMLAAALLLLVLVFHGAPERRHVILGAATVLGVLVPVPVIRALAPASGGLLPIGWLLVTGWGIATAAALTRIAARRAHVAAGLLETALTVEALAFAASAGGAATLPALLARLGAAAVIFLVYRERFVARSGSVLASARRSRAIAAVHALIAFQGSFVAALLPFTPFEQALLVTLMLILTREAVSLAMLGELSRSNLIKGTLAGVLGALILFAAAPWSV